MLSNSLKAKFTQNNLLKRIISTFVFVPLVLFILYVGGISYTIFSLVLSLLAIFELIKMTKRDKSGWRLRFACATIIIILFAYSSIYIRAYSLKVALYLLIVVWLTDTAAYFCGIIYGGRKLAPKYSPNKTISGAIGALIAVGIFSYFITPFDNKLLGILCGIILSAISQIGDISESALKRFCNVKDSGTLMPGHGGVMDRFDGLSCASIAMMLIISLLLP